MPGAAQSLCTQDLLPLLELVHRRCRDDKAAVRKGALQLLEALVVMRATWQGYPRQVPGSQDVALLEAATVDPLVRGCMSARVCCRVPEGAKLADGRQLVPLVDRILESLEAVCAYQTAALLAVPPCSCTHLPPDPCPRPVSIPCPPLATAFLPCSVDERAQGGAGGALPPA